VKAADQQVLDEARAHRGRHHEQAVGLPVIGGELGEELVVGDARRCRQPRRLPDAAADAFPLALGLLAAAAAQESEPPAPWKRLDGRDAGAVETCSRDGIAEVTTCDLVRCEESRMVFAIRGGDVAAFEVRRTRVRIGRTEQTIRLAAPKGDEQAIALSRRPRLLAALMSGAP
jgi:hypothetical protein